MRRDRIAAFTAAALLMAGVGVASRGAGASTPTATAEETTIGYSPARQNWDAGEPRLTTLQTGATAVGRLWDATVPGTTTNTPNQVYAQPIVADGQVVVATDDNEVAAYDPASGALDWQANLGPGWTPTPTCGDLSPHIGITSTPVYDPSTHTLYLIAKAADGPNGAPTLKIHALGLDDHGAERAGWPQTLSGAATNGGPALSAATSAQRAGLLLGDDGALYFATASHCDNGPFVGYVGRVPLATPAKIKLWATVSNNDNGQAGIWQAGGGIMSDGDDAAGHPRLFVVTGNGISSAPPTAAGSTASTQQQLSESVIRLQVGADGSLTAADFFSPSDNAHLDLNDADLGSGGPVALPDSFGSTAHPHLLVVEGKDGVVRLLDRDDLGGMGQGAGGSDDVVSSTPGKGVWGHAAVFDAGDGRHYAYLDQAGAPLVAYQITPDAGGTPTVTQAASTSSAIAFGSGSPVVTSDPNDPTTALVWVLEGDDASGANGRLVAYPAVPPANGQWQPIQTLPLTTTDGQAHPIAKFTQPATVGGRLFVGTRDGRVLAFAAPATQPVTGTSTDFGAVATGSSTTRTVALTTASGTTVTSVQAAAPFTTGTPATTGTSTSVPVTFTPTVGGRVSGTLTATTSTGAVYSFALRGTGTAAAVTTGPGSVDFGSVAVGQSTTHGVLLTNVGASAAVVRSAAVSGGSNAFTITGATPDNTSVESQGSRALTIRFTPAQVSSYQASLVLDTSDGTVTVPVTGTGYTGTPDLELSYPGALDLGQVPPGGSAAGSFLVRNTGDAALHITKAGQPAPPFFATIPVPEGVDLQPSTSTYDGAYGQVTVRPISAMPHTDVYTVSATNVPGGNPPPVTPRKEIVRVNTGSWSGPLVGHYGCLAFHGTAPASRAAAELAPCSGAAQQTLTRTGGGYYHLGAGNSPWCLQVNYSATRPGSPVALGRCTPTSTAHGQTWVVGAQGTLIDLHSHLCLRPRAGATASGTPLVVDTCSSTGSELWDASALTPARGALSSALGALGTYCLTDRGAGLHSGTPMELTGCALSGAGSRSQSIAHMGATLRVVGGCIAASGNAVVLAVCSGSSAQVWTSDSTGRLVNGAHHTCLTVPGNSTRAGTALTVAGCGAAAGQRWTLPDKS